MSEPTTTSEQKVERVIERLRNEVEGDRVLMLCDELESALEAVQDELVGEREEALASASHWKREYQGALVELRRPPKEGQGETEHQLSHKDRERLLKIADIIGGVHRPCADPELHEDDAHLLHQLILSQSPQDDVGRLREKLLSDEVRASAGYGAFKDRYPDEAWPAPDSAERVSWEGHAAAALEAALAALGTHAPTPDVERLGGEEGLRAALRAEIERLRDGSSRLLRVQAKRSVGAEVRLRASAERRVLSEQIHRLQAILDANPSPPLEHSKEEVDAFRELGKRLLGRAARQAGARVLDRAYDRHDETLEQIAAEVVIAVRNEATGHADFPLEPAPEHSKEVGAIARVPRCACGHWSPSAACTECGAPLVLDFRREHSKGGLEDGKVAKYRQLVRESLEAPASDADWDALAEAVTNLQGVVYGPSGPPEPALDRALSTVARLVDRLIAQKPGTFAGIRPCPLNLDGLHRTEKRCRSCGESEDPQPNQGSDQPEGSK